MDIGHHRCFEMPQDETDIAYTEKLLPFLSAGSPEGLFEFSVNMRVDFCPWCGKSLLAERNKWREGLRDARRRTDES